jgi:hypothetical protein
MGPVKGAKCLEPPGAQEVAAGLLSQSLAVEIPGEHEVAAGVPTQALAARWASAQPTLGLSPSRSATLLDPMAPGALVAGRLGNMPRNVRPSPPIASSYPFALLF